MLGNVESSVKLPWTERLENHKVHFIEKQGVVLEVLLSDAVPNPPQSTAAAAVANRKACA
jgi:hypothetical protein